MSLDEIIDRLNELALYGGELKHDRQALRAAIALLRTYPDVQLNEPLTLDELLKMDGQPVYLALDKKWYIVSVNYEPPRGEAQPCGIDLWGAGTSLRLLAECGMYRRPPKEAENLGK